MGKIRNAVETVRASVIAAFLNRCGPLGDMVKVYLNPTEEILDAAKRHRPVKMYARGGGMLAAAGQGARARLEENYLYDTRRFPTFVSGETAVVVDTNLFNVAGGVALAAGEYLFFGSAAGQPAGNNGFNTAATAVMSDAETNMDTPSQIPQGKDYVFTQIGISMNADVSASDASTLMEAGSIRFEKQGGQFTLRHGTPKLWPGGVGLDNVGVVNGGCDVRAVRKLAVPRVLRQKETFAYKYIVPRTNRNYNGTTVQTLKLLGPCLMTIWLWGGQQDAIPV